MYILFTVRGTAQLAALGYALGDVVQYRRLYAQAQMLQMACAVVVAASQREAAVVWLAMFSAMLHTAYAALLQDMKQTGDCRRCCNEAHGCTCGPRKDPLPPGTLRKIACLVERHYCSEDVRSSRKPR